jgi:hypothetical protein
MTAEDEENKQKGLVYERGIMTERSDDVVLQDLEKGYVIAVKGRTIGWESPSG